MKKLKTTASIFLIIFMLMSAFPLNGFAATTPNDVNSATATSRINTLVEKLVGKYFTTDGKPDYFNKETWECGDQCYNEDVIRSTWFKNLIMTPDDTYYMPYQYFEKGYGTNKGWSCFGFACYAQWYVFAQKSSDNVAGIKAGEATFSKSYIQGNVYPGDIVRVGGHSMIYISSDSNGFTVLDNNWGYDNRIQKHTVSWSFYNGKTCYISRPQNSKPSAPSESYNFDINISADGEYCAYGHDNVTFDVYINGSRVKDDVHDYSGDFEKGTTYEVKDISVSGCYRNNGNSSYSGSINSNVNVVIPIVTSHSPVTVSGRKATCTESGLTDGSKCSKCGVTLTAQQTIAALGHDYRSKTIAGTCTTPQKIVYTCSRCPDTYTIEGEWTDWSTQTPPDGVQYETKTQYRYSDYQTKTSYNTSEPGWTQNGGSWVQSGSGSKLYTTSKPSDVKAAGYHSNIDTSPYSASETTTTKRTVSNSFSYYMYYHWCRGTYENGPIDRRIADEGCGPQDPFNTFHSFSSTTDYPYYDYAVSHMASNRDACTDTYWWFRYNVYTSSYTDYKMLFNYYRWTDFSAWQDAAVSASSTRKVETRTQYRYQQSLPVEGHNWNDGVETTPATCESTGVMTFTCLRCNENKTETIPALGHDWGAWTNLNETQHQRVCANNASHVETADHIWNDGAVTTPATCKSTGEKTYTCTVCNATKTEKIAKSKTHKWDDGKVTTEPTVTSEGVKTYTCTVCGTTKTEAIPKLDAPTDTDAILTVAGVTAQPGATVTVAVDLTKAAPMSYLRLVLDYDTAALTLTGVQNGALFDTFDQGVSLLFSADENVTGTGRLLTLTFTVGEDAKAGAYSVTVLVKECYNNSEAPVTVGVEPGAVTVKDFVIGDVNGDGVIDGRDIIRLRKYLADYDEKTGTSGVEIAAGADCTGDGIVDGRDLIRLRKYIANLDEKTGVSTVTLG